MIVILAIESRSLTERLERIIGYKAPQP